MAGPNLEVFKFGIYVFFPLAVMVHYGDPDWYREHVLPIRDQFWPKNETSFKPPRNSESLKAAREEMKAVRLARREARLNENKATTDSAAVSGSSSRTTTDPSSQPTSSLSDVARLAYWQTVDKQRKV